MTNYYITLTTIPPRINIIQEILESFYQNQIYKPYKIILNIPNNYNRFIIDDNFNKIVYNISKSKILENILIINRCYDYGSATKILPTIDYFNNNNMKNIDLILIDDDLVYIDTFIENINLIKNKNGNDKIYCFTGYRLLNKPYRHPNFKYLNCQTITNCLEKIDIFGGVNGVYLNSSFFNQDIFTIINNNNFSKNYLYADDDFLSLYLKKIKLIFF